MAGRPNVCRTSPTPAAVLEDGLCSCIQATTLPLIAFATLGVAQVQWFGQLSCAILDSWRTRRGEDREPNWYGAHPEFELGFLLGKCGEERPFPSD